MNHFHEEQIHSPQTVRMDGEHEWRSGSRKLSSLCFCCYDWMWESRVPCEIFLLALIGSEQEPEIPHDHLLILTYLHRHDSIVSTCFTEAVDTKRKAPIQQASGTCSKNVRKMFHNTPSYLQDKSTATTALPICSQKHQSRIEKYSRQSNRL